MKKIICLLCLFLMLSFSVSYAETYLVNPTSSETIDSGGQILKSVYILGGSVVTGSPLQWEVKTPFESGAVLDVNYESTSDDVDMYFGQIEIASETDVNQFLWLEGFGDGVKPAFDPAFYRNMDTPTQKNSIYVTIINQSSTNTGTGYLTIVTRKRN